MTIVFILCYRRTVEILTDLSNDAQYNSSNKVATLLYATCKIRVSLRPSLTSFQSQITVRKVDGLVKNA